MSKDFKVNGAPNDKIALRKPELKSALAHEEMPKLINSVSHLKIETNC